MISTILFDFGGTLDYDGGHWLDRFYLIYSKLGLNHIPKERIKEAFYWADTQAEADPDMRQAGFREMMNKHVRWQFEKLGIRDTKREAQAAEAFAKPSERILHRNRHILEKLKLDGFRMGVISNFYGNVETLCKEASLHPYFEVVIDSAIAGVRKPDPRIFHLALEKLEIEPGHAVMVGDSFERDIIPARTLGMKTFWMVGDRVRTPPDPSQVDAMIYSLEDLPAKLSIFNQK